MSCPNAAHCLFPACCGRAWRADDPADAPKFLADVKDAMRASGAPFGKAVARVYAEAVAERAECMLS